MNKRNSSIELLKIFAIFIILISHLIPYYLDNISIVTYNYATTDPYVFTLICFRYLGHLGNAIFIACSAYFMCHSEKSYWKKALLLLFETEIISWTLTIINVCTTKVPLSTLDILNSVFPISFGQYWFIGSFIIYLLFTPLWNKLIHKLPKKKAIIVVSISAVVSFIIVMIINFTTNVNASFAVSDNIAFNIFGYYMNCVFNGFVFLVVGSIIYLLKTYKKEWMENTKLNVIVCVSSFILLYVCLIAYNAIALNVPAINNRMLAFDYFLNPFMLLFAISLVNIANKKVINVKFVNFLSSLSLFIYVMTENTFMHKAVYDPLFSYFYNFTPIYFTPLLTLLFSVMFFVGGVIASTAYKYIIDKPILCRIFK